jgi:hypothetical protein
MIVKEQFPYLIENTQTQAINYKVYSKVKCRTVADDAFTYMSDEQRPADTDFGLHALPLRVDSVNEFPFKLSTDFDKAVQHEGQVVVVCTELQLTKATLNALELVISVTDKKDEAPHSYSAKSAGDYVWKQDSTIFLYSDQYIGVNYSELKSHSNLNAFIWNRGKESFQIRHSTLKVIDYWPQKWQWWN